MLTLCVRTAQRCRVERRLDWDARDRVVGAARRQINGPVRVGLREPHSFAEVQALQGGLPAPRLTQGTKCII